MSASRSDLSPRDGAESVLAHRAAARIVYRGAPHARLRCGACRDDAVSAVAAAVTRSSLDGDVVEEVVLRLSRSGRSRRSPPYAAGSTSLLSLAAVRESARRSRRKLRSLRASANDGRRPSRPPNETKSTTFLPGAGIKARPSSAVDHPSALVAMIAAMVEGVCRGYADHIEPAGTAVSLRACRTLSRRRPPRRHTASETGMNAPQPATWLDSMKPPFSRVVQERQRGRRAVRADGLEPHRLQHSRDAVARRGCRRKR